MNLTAERSKSTGYSSTKNEYLVNLYQDRRHSLYEGIFGSPTATTDLDWSLLKRPFVYEKEHVLDVQMGSVDQDDIIALTKHVRSFSESLNSLRNTINDSLTSKRKKSFYHVIIPLIIFISQQASILNS